MNKLIIILMNIFLNRARNKLQLDEGLYVSMVNIIQSENNNIKYDNFKKIINYKATYDKEKLNHHFIRLLLYTFNTHKDFKNDLLVEIKHPQNKELNFQLFDMFLDTLEFDCTDIGSLEYNRLKLKVFNNFYETVISTEYVKTNGFIENVETFLNNILIDLTYHLQNVNDDVYQMLITFLKFFSEFYKNYIIPRDKVNKKVIAALRDLMNQHEEIIVQFNRDFEFSLAYCYFQLLFNTNSFEFYLTEGVTMLSKVTEKPFYLFSLLKAFLINIKDTLICDYILTEKLILFHDTLTQYMFNSEIDQTAMTIFELYITFLRNDFKSNFTNILNDIFLACLQKIDNLNTLKPFINDNFIQDILLKMRRDKVHFYIMDDNYYNIINILAKIDSNTKQLVSVLSYKYLRSILINKERLMIIEVRLFKFLKFTNELNLDLMKQYFEYIFSKKFDKKNLSLINDYIKIMADFYFNSNNEVIILKPELLYNKYQQFLEVFSGSFYKYLLNTETKNLKFFTNLLVNMEKFNKNLYAVIVNHFYRTYFIEEKIDSSRLYAVFITLLRPFRDYKKSLLIDNEKISFNLVVIDKLLELNIILNLKELKILAKSIDRFLVTYILEFVVGIEEPDKVYPIIITILKYNVKTSYVEYKTSLMKMLTIYFIDYNIRLVKLLNKSKLNNEENNFVQRSITNFESLFQFLSNNIYDRPVENLLVYIDILKQNLELFGKINECKSETKNKFKEILERFIYHKYFAMSLVSLLNKSWYFIKNGCYLMLMRNEFKSCLSEIKSFLIAELDNNYSSLRQMEAEGSILIFTLLLHHFKEIFLNGYFNRKDFELYHPIKDSDDEVNYTTINIFHEVLTTRKCSYFEYLELNGETNYISIHYLFIFLKTVLELERDTSFESSSNILTKHSIELLGLASLIYEMNKTFKKHLVNNGVSEFNIEGCDNFITDTEDKRLISLWCSTKYSIECLNLIFDIINNNYKILYTNDSFIKILKYLETFIQINIDLMIDSEHMGAIRLFNDLLLKVTKLVKLFNLA
jgi:hypothetical protein